MRVMSLEKGRLKAEIMTVLACVYAAEPIAIMVKEPSYTDDTVHKYPIVIKVYVDDFSLLAISKSFADNNTALNVASIRLVLLLERIGLRIEPIKSDIIHFGWRRDGIKPEPLTLNLYGRTFTLTPPKSGYVRWLGVFLDPKLSFKLHIKVMAERGKTIIQG